MSFKQSPTGKAESRGREAILFLGCTSRGGWGERPSCRWAAPAAALRKKQLVTKQKSPRLILPRVNHAKGGSAGLLC